MAENTSSRNDAIQELLVEAVEVQLAAFNASISFWTDWVQEASRFSEQTMQRLNELRSEPAGEGRLLLEISDLTRENLRTMTHLPRRAAENFLRELDGLEAARKPGGKTRKRPGAKRSVRVKS
jgi:hypothetical protein